MFDAQSEFQLFDEASPHKTPLKVRLSAKAKRDAIKAAGGAEYEALLAKERAARAKWRAKYPGKREAERKRYKRKRKGFRIRICGRARARARQRGIEGTIKPSDLIWPTHCPVLGIELHYPKEGELRKGGGEANWPSLDRWDSAKGYVPGNVFVISYRANTIKNNATYEEILKVAKYLAKRPRP